MNVEDVQPNQCIRPEGWYDAYEVIAVEDTDVPEMVKVLWFVGCTGRIPSPWPPDAHTYFQRGEQVEVVF